MIAWCFVHHFAKFVLQEAKAVPLFEEVAWKLVVQLHAEGVEDSQPARLVVCLDHSGSMAGSPLTAVSLAA